MKTLFLTHLNFSGVRHLENTAESGRINDTNLYATNTSVINVSKSDHISIAQFYRTYEINVTTAHKTLKTNYSRCCYNVRNICPRKKRKHLRWIKNRKTP